MWADAIQVNPDFSLAQRERSAVPTPRFAPLADGLAKAGLPRIGAGAVRPVYRRSAESTFAVRHLWRRLRAARLAS